MDVPPQAWAAATALVGTLLGFLGGRPRSRADAASQLTDASVRLVNELQEELRDMRARLIRIEAEVHDCEHRYAELLREVRRRR